MLKRCYLCLRFIWPWQHYGVRVEGRPRYWHVGCRRIAYRDEWPGGTFSGTVYRVRRDPENDRDRRFERPWDQ